MPRATSPPRRSNRKPTAPSHSNSVSSNSSNRNTERSTRTINKQSSPQKSSTPQSLSSEELLSDLARAATSEPPTRRSKRQLDIEDEEASKVQDEVGDEVNEDEETTRCICEQVDYPGPPPLESPVSLATKGNQVTSVDPDAQGEEAGGLFIQCDVCKVWQHGGCVGIMDQAAAPENYYCELCKSDLHQVSKAMNGQKYSRYLPVWEKFHPKPPRKPSIVKDGEVKSIKERKKLAQSLPDALGKRRSTMNSRSAYDEDEVLRKVLEQSKTDGSVGADNESRKGKRARDDSEGAREDVKRQRTISSAVSSGQSDAGSSTIESEADGQGGKSAKKPRGGARKNQREKGAKETEKKRAEAANKRKGRFEGRFERRRGEGSIPPEDSPNKQLSNGKPSPTSQEPRDAIRPPLASVSKRGGRRPGRGRGGHHMATPSERGSKAGSPKEAQDNLASGVETPGAQVANQLSNGNGASAKRGRGRKEEPSSNDSDKDKSDGNAGKGKSNTSDPSSKAPADGIGNGHANGSGTSHGAKDGREGTAAKKEKSPSMSELKRRANAMVEFLANAQADFPIASGSVAESKEANVMSSLLGVEAERLKGRLEKWQAEFA